MRLHCWCCGKSVSTDVPDETVLRAVAICPECIEAGEATLRDDDLPADRCGALHNGRRCVLANHHDASMNATPHDYGVERRRT